MKYKDALSYAKNLRKNQTPTEKFFWNKVRNRNLFDKKFKRQYPIQHAEIMGEKYFYIADFYCHEKKLLIELDGKIHLHQKEYDEDREARLTQMGFQVVRFKNEEVLKDWESVREKLKEILIG